MKVPNCDIDKLIACIRYAESKKPKDPDKFIRVQNYISQHIGIATRLIICGCYRKDLEGERL
ncbi:MAG: hypothetical protein ABIB47_02320 [Candidatus Woesearchaeota archaeon]